MPCRHNRFADTTCIKCSKGGGTSHAIRKAISIGGDSDTIACMTGGIAQAYYREIPEYMKQQAMRILDSGLKRVAGEFEEKYLCK